MLHSILNDRFRRENSLVHSIIVFIKRDPAMIKEVREIKEAILSKTKISRNFERGNLLFDDLSKERQI